MAFLYRVDKRNFKIGDTIEPVGIFEDKLDEEKAEIEAALDENRLNGIPHRKDCLFLFQSISAALLFASKYGGNIYAVEPHNIYHRGDMNILDNILSVFRYSEDPDIRKASVVEYWKTGSHTFFPCYELLVESAVVKNIISEYIDPSRLRDEIRNYGIIENTPTYIKLVKEYM